MNYWLLNKSERGDINFFSVVYSLGTPTSSRTYFQPCGQALVKPRGSQNKGTNVGERTCKEEVKFIEFGSTRH